MAKTLGQGRYTYELVPNWGPLPEDSDDVFGPVCPADGGEGPLRAGSQRMDARNRGRPSQGFGRGRAAKTTLEGQR